MPTTNRLFFLKNQLLLFAKLCVNRNYNSVQYLKESLPLETMISYTLNNSLDMEVRACFCQLIQNIYIDKEPRTILMKPNLVRIIENSQREQDGGIFKFFDKMNVFRKSRSASLVKKINTMKKLGTPGSGSPLKKLLSKFYNLNNIYFTIKIDDNTFEPNSGKSVKDEKKELLAEEEKSPSVIQKDQFQFQSKEEESTIEGLKNDLLTYLSNKKSELISSKNGSSSVYNVLTLEVISLFHNLLQFGLINNKFKSGSPKKMEGSKVNSPSKRLASLSPLKFFAAKSEYEKNDIEKLVDHLSVLLEYDESYFVAIKELEIKRSKFFII